MVLLPGALMTPQHIVDAGLFDAVAQRGLALDLMALDLHAHEAGDGPALQILEQQVLAPARTHYRHVWLGGISRGGQLALSYRAEQVGRVDGMCLLAPYPGSRLTTNAITRAGGLQAWQPSAEQWRDPEFRLWHWLKHPGVEEPLFLGYGTQDRFADGMQRLVAQLPKSDVHIVPGGHDWTAWSPLWASFLALGHFGARP
jgi:pimeloyl-ACP methyl ester carboxylesterase